MASTIPGSRLSSPTGYGGRRARRARATDVVTTLGTEGTVQGAWSSLELTGAPCRHSRAIGRVHRPGASRRAPGVELAQASSSVPGAVPGAMRRGHGARWASRPASSASSRPATGSVARCAVARSDRSRRRSRSRSRNLGERDEPDRHRGRWVGACARRAPLLPVDPATQHVRSRKIKTRSDYLDRTIPITHHMQTV